MSSGKTKKVGIITGFYRFRNKKPSKLDGLSLELLARFELAARLHEIHDFMEASRPRIEIDEVASSRFQ